MNVLVTGAAGFIGHHLCSKLLENGFTVVGIDNMNDYYPVSLKIDRLKALGIDSKIEDEKPIESSMHSNFSFVKLDIGNKDSLEYLFDKYKFNTVCNLAAQAGVRNSIENPDVYIQSNVVGFGYILELCQKHKIDHLLYASSSSVYGDNSKIPFSVEDRVDNPISMYAATKKSNELMAHVYSHLYGFKTTGLRFFTVYGPWGRPDMAPFLFADAILNDRPIKVFNNGEMLRDFTYIDDIVLGIYKIITQVKEDREPYKIHNIGNSDPVNLLNFIETLEHHLGKDAEKIMMPMQPGDVKVTYADVNDLKKEFSYKPNTNISDGVEKFVSWYKEYYQYN